MTSPFSLRILIKMIRFFFFLLCLHYLCFLGVLCDPVHWFGSLIEDFLGRPLMFRSGTGSGDRKVCVGVLQGLNGKLHGRKIYWAAVCFPLGMVPFPQTTVPGSCLGVEVSQPALA